LKQVGDSTMVMGDNLVVIEGIDVRSGLGGREGCRCRVG
jgi:hypothetical protein